MLKRLLELNGVSGFEDPVRDAIKEAVAPYCDRMETDALGNLMVLKKGRVGAHRVMVAAHMDEVGLIVSAVTDAGHLRFKTVGGVDARVLIAKRVRIGALEIPGVIGAKPPHQKKKDDDSVPKTSELFIDIGAANKEEALRLVSPGDVAVFDSPYQELGNRRIQSKGLDDRVGCSILCSLLKETYEDDLYAVFTVQEEVGCKGAQVAAYEIAPDLAIVLEGTTCNDVPGSDQTNFSTHMGEGPAISIMDRGSFSDQKLVEALAQTAKEHQIPFQYKQTTMGGNDASKIHVARGGIRTAVVSVPCRYIHSPASVASMEDIEGAQQLVRVFLNELEERVWSC